MGQPGGEEKRRRRRCCSSVSRLQAKDNPAQVGSWNNNCRPTAPCDASTSARNGWHQCVRKHSFKGQQPLTESVPPAPPPPPLLPQAAREKGGQPLPSLRLPRPRPRRPEGGVRDGVGERFSTLSALQPLFGAAGCRHTQQVCCPHRRDRRPHRKPPPCALATTAINQPRSVHNQTA